MDTILAKVYTILAEVDTILAEVDTIIYAEVDTGWTQGERLSHIAGKYTLYSGHI